MAGSINLQTASGGNYVITPEDFTGTKNISLSPNGFGNVLQVQHVQLTGTGEITTTSASWTASGFYIDFTPVSANSKLIVDICVATKHNGGNASDGWKGSIFRDGVRVQSGTAPSAHAFQYESSIGNTNRHHQTNVRTVETSNSTATTRFELYFACYSVGTAVVTKDWGLGTIVVYEVEA